MKTTLLLAAALLAVAASACTTTNTQLATVHAAAPAHMAREPMAFDAARAEQLLDQAELGSSKAAGQVQRMLLDQSKSLETMAGNADLVHALDRAHKIFGTKKLRQMADHLRDRDANKMYAINPQD